MFICQHCGLSRREGETVPVSFREKDYYEVRGKGPRAHRVLAGHGHEIVHEERVCTDCLHGMAEVAA